MTILVLDASSSTWRRNGRDLGRDPLAAVFHDTLTFDLCPVRLNSERQDKGARKRDTCCLLCHCPMIYARPIIVPRFLATLSPLLVLVVGTKPRDHNGEGRGEELESGGGKGRRKGLWVKSPRESKPLVEWLWL